MSKAQIKASPRPLTPAGGTQMQYPLSPSIGCHPKCSRPQTRGHIPPPRLSSPAPLAGAASPLCAFLRHINGGSFR